MIKNFIKTFCISTAVIAGLLCLLTFVTDPFFHYHKPWFGLKAVLTDKEYQCLGTLKNFDYNAVLAGSSVVENNDNSWYDDAFGVKTIKAVRSYGGIADLTYMVNTALDTHEVEKVFFNLDPAALVKEPVTTFEETGCPMYLYDNNPFNDIKYLLNVDVIFEKIPYMIAQSVKGYNEDLSYNWAQGKDFSVAGTLSQYTRLKETEPMQDAESRNEELYGNIKMLRDMIESNPDTEFTFFIPPYSMVWWDDSRRNGLEQVYLHAQKETLRALLEYENVKVYDFQNEEEVITNLNNYMDTVHFTPEINHEIVNWLVQGHGRVTNENLDAVFEKTQQFADRNEKQNMKPLEEQGAFTMEQ